MALKTLRNTIGFDEILSRLHFTYVALGLCSDDGDTDVAALLPPFAKLLSRWNDLDKERSAQALATVRANALCKRRNMQLDAALTALHHATLALAGQDRKSALFSHLFPRPLSELSRPALEGQLKVVAAIVERLSQSEPHAALKKAHDKPLREALAAGEAAIKERTKQLAAAAELTRRIDVLWEDGNTALQAVEGGLKTLSAKRRLGRDFVESFFPDRPASARSAKSPKPLEPATAAPA